MGTTFIPVDDLGQKMEKIRQLTRSIDCAVEQHEASPSYAGARAIQHLIRQRDALWETLPRNKPEPVT